MTSESPAPNRNIPALRAYLERNRGVFTDEALTEALLKEGYTKEDVQAGLAWLGVAEASKPVRARARRIVLAAYGITYAVLVIGMLRNGSTAAVGIPVLTVAVALAVWIALRVVRRSTGRGADAGAMVLTGMLAIPVIILVIVAGLCVASGLPFQPTTV